MLSQSTVGIEKSLLSVGRCFRFDGVDCREVRKLRFCSDFHLLIDENGLIVMDVIQ